MAGGEGRAALRAAGAAQAPLTLAGERLLPVLPPLQPLLPAGGLQRGAVVGVTGCGSTSLTLGLTAGASGEGAWIVAVGLESLGLVAAGELGVALDRLVLVSSPGADQWPTVVAALVDAFDAVVVAPRHRVKAGDVRRLTARARERGAALLVAGGAVDRWPEAPDVTLEVVTAQWVGLDQGYGALAARRVVVEGGGRRAAGRTRRTELWLPGPEGGVAAASSDAPITSDGDAGASGDGAVVPLRRAG